MALLLGIETATNVCSVSLSREGSVLLSKETDEPNAHSRLLAEYVRDVLREAGLSPASLDAVVVSKGPGSYTGLRIGVSTAKGLCYGLDIPLISVSTLRSMAGGAISAGKQADLYCPLIDARRMEVYAAVYDGDLMQVMDTRAMILDEHSFHDRLDQHSMLFFGSGAEKCRNMISHPNARFDLELRPSAANLAAIGWERFQQAEFEDVAYFEPFYLKDFVAGKPRVKGLFD